MSESMLVIPSAGAGGPTSKLSSMETTNNLVSNEESGSFNAALENYSEIESGTTEQISDDALTDSDELLPQDMPENGNTLPLDENTAVWQALLLLQPAETLSTNPATSQAQSISLLDSRRQPVLNSVLGNQDYFNTMLMQNKDATSSLPAGFITNNPNMQLSAAHFSPESNEALLLNMTEQLTSVQGVNSTISHGLAAVGFGTAIQAANTQTQMAPLSLGQYAWESNLGSKLQMLIGQNVQTAEIRLDPPELGTLDIKIKVVNDIATVNITSANAHVREALEAAVPRLREMFDESGISLGDVNVRQESFTHQENTEGEKAGSIPNGIDAVLMDDEDIPIQKVVSNNLLDIYA